ncbi:MAG TPA: DUF6259 domain-containing protein [Candidatus Anammoximicrobium sp.]|nr:DUF6259 domain-containing protein [Candidatus Anammoximicrobium sp.]
MKYRTYLRIVVSLVASVFGSVVLAEPRPSFVESLPDGVLLVRDDAGNWGGPTMGITHQRGTDYWAKKVLDLSGVSDEAWNQVREVRLSAFFCVRDYSWHDCPPANGLDEAIELVVNGHAHRVPTNAGLPAYDEGKSMTAFMRWHDFALPKDEIVRGLNEIVLRMAPVEGKRPDDYLYLGIDTTAAGGNSFVRFGAGAPWQEDKLTIPGGRGEYMVRLYLLSRPRNFEARWLPADSRLEDARQMICYAGSHGPTTRVEWNPRRVDRLESVRVRVEIGGSDRFRFAWLDEAGNPVQPADVQGPVHEATLSPPLAFVPSGVELPKNLDLRSVALSASADYHPLARQANVAPAIQTPAGRPVDRSPSCRIDADRILMANRNLRCEFARQDGRLRLTSLYNEFTAGEMVRRSEDVALWLVEVEGKRYAGSSDFVCRDVTATEDGTGFRATCVCDAAGLEAVWTATMGDSLQLSLNVVNRSSQPVDFKLAFPHFAGLSVSPEPAGDFYFYPKSLLVSDAPALIRQGYGDHQALYQVMDIFSPSRGGGLAMRCLDGDGRYKVLALRKHLPGHVEQNEDAPQTPTADEYKWSNSLPAVPGISLTYEYLRRTRPPGASFAPPAVTLTAHAGDWQAVMQEYAQWCRQVWQFRPYPSRLTPAWNMIAAGWGLSPIFRDGKYRTDLVGPRCDCIELMSWWEWSPLGPTGVPLDQFSEKLGAAKYEMWKSYFPPDPVSGQPMFSNNPGDYDGYNERWGGLPAFRQAIEAYRQKGALVTLYTDPFRVDHSSKCGRQHGERWGVVQPDGSYRDDYDAWRMCHDVAEYRQWVADNMQRVLKETGADGIRLDEYGHAGSACFSRKHEHTFAEWGCTEWQRGVAEATRLVRQAMDQVNPQAVLTTEHPGYDFLLPHIEGCITYDLTVLASPLRPVEVNLQRFLFPECKAFELDHRGADPTHRKRFWNAVGSFGSCYPPSYDAILRENADAFASRQCRPLVPTPAGGVYANWFRGQDKEIYTLYNGTGHTFYGLALSVELPPDRHIFDLLRCEEADAEPTGGRHSVRLFLPRDDVACLAVLPRKLTVVAAGDRLQIRTSGADADSRVAVCGRDGGEIASRPLTDGQAEIRLGPAQGQGLCVKLYRGGQLEDAVAGW